MPNRTEHPARRLLTIGEFSRLAHLSIRMLRHYDERGVLRPARTDPSSGYRLYAAEQLRDAHRVVGLRDVGFSVAAIAAVLPVYDDPDVLGSVLAAHRGQLVADANSAAQRLGAVDHLLTRLTEDTMSAPTITLTTAPARTVASLRATIPTYSDEGMLWTRFMEWFPTSGAVFSPTMRSGATFHDVTYRDADVDVEIWMEVAAPFQVAEPELAQQEGMVSATVACQTLPEQQVLAGTVYGDYSGVGAVTEQIGQEMAARSLAAAGPGFNVYVVSPGQDPDPAAWITEIYLPVRPA